MQGGAAPGLTEREKGTGMQASACETDARRQGNRRSPGKLQSPWLGSVSRNSPS